MKKYVELSMLLAISIILGILESFIPNIVVGAKLGLANIASLLVICIYGFKEGIIVALLRILIVSLLLGTFLSVVFYMSLCGGLCAVVTMFLLKKLKMHMVSISVGGAFMHSVGQMLVAMFIISKESMYYFPLMGLMSIVTGIFIGIITSRVVKIRKKYLMEGENIETI